MTRLHQVLVASIILLAAIVRFYNINTIPVSLYWDEVAFGYNAYSISQTLKDEYGTFLPLLFRSFDDYKLPGNVYITAVSVALFRLNEFSIRFPSAFIGTITILVTYLFVRELVRFFSEEFLKVGLLHRKVFTKKILEALPLLVSSMLAISPWHIQFSRAGFEANIGLFLIICGAWLFFRAFREQQYFVYSMLSFGLAFWTYRSVHIFLPLLLLGSGIIFGKDILNYISKRYIILALFILFAISLPILYVSFSSEGLARVRQVNVFLNAEEKIRVNAQKIDESDNSIISRIIYNRRIVYIQEFIYNYTSFYGYKFLFTQGDGNLRHGSIGSGLLYLWQLPFVIIGLLLLLFLPRKLSFLILLWLLITPIPAALSLPVPHALRSFNGVVVPQLLTGFGLLISFSYISKKFTKIFGALLSFLIITFFILYLHQYFIVTPTKAASSWADGYKQLTEYVFKNEYKYDKVIITGYYWQPYIYFLFYKNYDPALFQKTGSQIGFDKYLFGGTSWDKDKGREELHNMDLAKLAQSKKILIVLSKSEYESQKNNIDMLTQIKNHNNDIVFIVGTLR